MITDVSLEKGTQARSVPAVISSQVVTPFAGGVRPKRTATARPRIAMVSTHGYVAAEPPLGAADTGGQVVYVLELSKTLARLGYEVDIWTRRFEDQPEMEPVADGVRILRVPCGGPAFLPKEYLCRHLEEWGERAVAYARAHGLTYAFVNSHYWDGGLAGEALAHALGAPHLHTPHSLGRWKKQQMETDSPLNGAQFEQRYNFTQRIREEERLYATCARVVATSALQAEYIAETYAVETDRLWVVPPGYDVRRFFPVSEAKRHRLRARFGFEGKAVLALGRLARNKGYDLLIAAFPLLVAREPDARLYLAIGGAKLNSQEEALLAELRVAAERTGCADRIHFRSFVPDEDLPDTYRAADLFVLCSRYEPFGMTAVEAMASGTPTVVTVHGGLYRSLAFGHDALFADPFDREDLGITMWKAFRHQRLRRRLARTGARQAKKLFTWEGVAQTFLRETTRVEPLPEPAGADALASVASA